MTVIALLPLKANSTRVPKKNIKTVGKYTYGITEIKLEQLINCDIVDAIFVSSESDEILDIVSKICKKYKNKKKLILNKRPIEFAGDCPTDKWIAYLSTQMTNYLYDDVLFVHATSPFFNKDDMKSFYNYYVNTQADSAATANCIKNFLWKDNKPFNYSIEEHGKWPLTQTLDNVYEINSAGFLFKRKDFIITKDRLPGKPVFYETTWMSSLDIDYPEDFERFQTLWKTFYE